jgi:tetraacyldisaccharide 4'-kinase
MNRQQFVTTHLSRRSFLSYLLFPLSLPFVAVVVVRRAWYRISPPKPEPGKARVIVVGNLTAGGSGKTPFTACLVRQLTDAGCPTAVCLRGYRGEFEHTNAIVADRSGIRPEGARAGDEALMLSRQLPGIPIAVGRDRKRSIAMLQAMYPDLRAIVLDDGFQRVNLFAHFRFAVFNTRTGIGNGFVLPAGLLREPLSALRDADAIVLNGDPNPELEKQFRFRGTIVRGSMKLDYLESFEGEKRSLTGLKGKVCLLSGIGSPEGFERSMRQAGLKVAAVIAKPDHYAFDEPELWEHLCDRVNGGEFESIIITEKDAVKIKPVPGLRVYVACSRFVTTTNVAKMVG